MSASAPQPTPDEPPDALLDHVSQLRRQARARSRGAWLPLLVFALLTLATTLLYRQPFYTLPASGGGGYSFELPSYAGLPWSQRSAALSIAFWLVLAPLCYLGCALWYHWRAERRGVSLRWQTWVWAGLGLFGVLVVVLVGQRLGWLRLPYYGPPRGGMLYGPGSALSPLLAIALGLLVLARVERSRGVAVTAIVYGGLATVMNLYGLGQIPPWIVPPLGGSNDAFVAAGPNLLLLASILLVGAAMTGRPKARSARRAARPASRLA
jgi:hypothetical protein